MKETDKIITINLADEMKKSYIDYAMSVIVARALPDVRDGLKPVHRRILHSMNELNLEPGKPYKKSARITGDVMGKYHPHGDSAIYDAMVRMAQDFSMRYMLVDGHGNFGSMDGDEPAASRYTEARLSHIAMEMIRDIEKDTVDHSPNYTEELTEPSVMPARYPNLLVNGAHGIAVGMATNIPPHNLNEVIDGVVKIIDNLKEGRETHINELLEIIKGPDFPTGGKILGVGGIKSAYSTGRGKIALRAVCDIEEGNGRAKIVITEFPYQVNKARFQEKVGELVNDKKIDGISGVGDESDRNGVRVVVELKKDANPHVVLNLLYKHTQLQESFGVNMLALVKNQPRILNIHEMLSLYLEHQEDVVTRRTAFDLNRANKRRHIVDGFLKALDHIDEIISIIRANREIARSKEIIMDSFGFTQAQADAIVEMRLRALSGLERERLEDELKKLLDSIAYLSNLLSDVSKLRDVIKDELLEIKSRFGDERRTEIIPEEGEIILEDLIDPQECVLTLTKMEYIKRQPLDTYKIQNRGGKGITGLTTREEDIIKQMLLANTHDDLLIFTCNGVTVRAYKLRAYQVPEAGRQAKGTAIVNLLEFANNEQVISILPIRSTDWDKGNIFFVSRFGVVKKTPIALYERINRRGVTCLTLKMGDALAKAFLTTGEDDIFLATAQGLGIKFDESKVRPMGRAATGIRGISLMDGDEVIGGLAIDKSLEQEPKILFVSINGFGKCTPPSMFRTTNRGGKGVVCYKGNERVGKILGVAKVGPEDEVILINSDGIIIRLRVSDISTLGRAASGVKLFGLSGGVDVVSIAEIKGEYIKQIEEEVVVE